MKWLLIVMALNGEPLHKEVVYADEKMCDRAVTRILEADGKAICIPHGEDKGDRMMLNFFDLVDKLQAMEQNKGLDNAPK